MTATTDPIRQAAVVDLTRHRLRRITDDERLIHEAREFARHLVRRGESGHRAYRAAEQWAEHVLYLRGQPGGRPHPDNTPPAA